MHEWIVVGGGFSGAVLAERIATQLNKHVLLIDRRSHIAGNAYDRENEDGILFHQYGPHIFHTKSEKVWNYLSSFSEWRFYEHHVLASIDGNLIPLPFNLNSINQCFSVTEAMTYRALLLEYFGEGARVPILTLRKTENPELRRLGNFVYEKIFHHYTIKQWDLLPEQLSPSVTARVPILVGGDDRYFQDEFQFIPLNGYTALIQSILNDRRIKVQLNTTFGQAEYKQLKQSHPNTKFIFTGPIDEFFGHCFGALPYRSLRFEHKTYDEEWRQPVGTVNFPNEHNFTRTTEIKHVTGQKHRKTTITYEFPEKYFPNVNEPYYPIPRDETREVLNRYLELAKKFEDIFFCGRLGDYQYYNMDQAVAAALSLYEKKIASCK